MEQRSRNSILFFLVPLCFIAACTASRDTAIPSYPNVNVTNLGEGVNSKYDDYAPVLFSGSQKLLFTSNRSLPDGTPHGDDFWIAERLQSNWTNATNVLEINSEKDEGGACISSDGKTAFFVECWTKDGFGDADIYSASIVEGKWEKIKNLGKGINTKYWDSMPFISADGSELYFASDRPGGYGGTDIYISKLLRSGAWGEPRNLGSDINTSDDEKSPILSPNGEMLYFASNGLGGVGGFDIYISKLVRNRWSNPQNAGTPINSSADELYFSLSAEEDTIYISSSRSGGFGRFDLWMTDRNPFKDSARYEFYVTGRVIDSVTNRSVINATLHIDNKANGETFTLASGANGQYRFRTNLGVSYDLQATAKGYHETRTYFAVPKKLSYAEFRKNISINPIIVEKPETTAVPFIMFFDFDQADIRDDAKPVLDRTVIEVKKYATCEILIDAHTDERGTEAYNIDLSRERGASVSEFLASHGIPVEWISITPHGEVLPIATNETDEGRQKNRRVEIRINGKRSPQQ